MKRCFLIIFVLALALLPLSGGGMGLTAAATSGDSSAKSKIKLPEDLSTDKVDDILARMSDEQVRELLIEELKKEADDRARQDKSAEDISINIWEKNGALVKSRIIYMMSGFPIFFQELANIYDKLTSGQGFSGFLPVFLSALALLAGAFLIERLFDQRIKNLRYQLGESEPPNIFIFGRRVIARIALEALSLGLFFLSGFIIFSLFFPESGPLRIFAGRVFLAVFFARIFIFISALLLSPDSRHLRLVPVQDETARYLHKGMVVLGWVWFLSLLLAILSRDLNAAPQVFQIMRILSTLLAALVIIYLLWDRRRQVADLIIGDSPEKMDGKPSPRVLFARAWHILGIVYVILMLVLWVASFLLQEQAAAGKLLFSFMVVPIFLALDRIGIRGLAWVFNLQAGEVLDLEKNLNAPISGPADEPLQAGVGLETAPEPKATANAGLETEPEVTTGTGLETAPEVTTVPKEPPSETALGRHFLTARAILRLVLLMGLVLALTKLWGLPLPLAEYVTSSIVEIFATLFAAAVFWQFVKNTIEKRTEDKPGQHLHDEPGIGTPGTRGRSKTLLLLLKKFIGVVLIILVTLIVLSALGVNIWPLLAGAGVFGIAIGFGAQSLVRDIITGIFYLTDDAFRIGDYIEAGKVSGSVEHISIRSIRLRHHRGKLQFVPYGQMGVITNYLRGPIINKFNFRLPLDTDIEQFRKIVKKAGKRLEEDPEVGPHLVGTVKSQGVKDIDQNALLFRVKLTAMPPYHILAKRTAFNLITEELAKEGIRFPHPNVTVQIPKGGKTLEDEGDMGKGPGEDKALPPDRQPEDENDTREIITAAGAAALITSLDRDGKKNE